MVDHIGGCIFDCSLAGIVVKIIGRIAHRGLWIVRPRYPLGGIAVGIVLEKFGMVSNNHIEAVCVRVIVVSVI